MIVSVPRICDSGVDGDVGTGVGAGAVDAGVDLVVAAGVGVEDAEVVDDDDTVDDDAACNSDIDDAVGGRTKAPRRLQLTVTPSPS